ncbi:MAG TPA: poly-gamma-glutamate biosynthesis protein PgsC/CapC [Pseudomonadales bacterium]|nr:poly-gamma-glutamate biosynthesis protein PgsC/CapC [Pseudomonadales bacterium]
MEGFVLDIFPRGGLDSSVITTVWVGVVVVAFFNLRFGWVLSGLVVPGYLVPLLIAKPVSAGVVFGEAIVTYGVVLLLAGPLARIRGWSSFFGRDRFFALVLVSVIVRVTFDGWLLPLFGTWLNDSFALDFDYRNNLHSFGLIIIALMANQYWKTGLLRGLPPQLVTLAITFVVVRYGLMEFTNFRVSGLSYMFEDVTDSILASPKAYIILLTTAFVASRMNLFYGWEFNGILIPSLLALQWYEPSKILISFAEAFLILAIGIQLLRIPALRDANIEGARKLLLFFNISFAWKMLLSVLLLTFLPSVKVSDFFAFGYLLSTLMAIKMHDKQIALRLTWSTVTTSFVAIVIASLIGFSLTLLPGPATSLAAGAGRPAAPAVEADLKALIAREKGLLYEQIGTYAAPLPTELDAFRSALSVLRTVTSVEDPRLPSLDEGLAEANYELVIVGARWLVLRERAPRRGWGTFVLNPGAGGRAVVEVPAPLLETGTAEAGLALFLDMDASGFALGGARRRFERTGPVALLDDLRTPFFVFHDVIARRGALMVRGYRPSTRRALLGDRDTDPDTPAPNTIWVSGELPAGVNLGALRARLGGLAVRFEGVPEANVIREQSDGAFAELLLDRTALRRLAAQLAGSATAIPVARSARSLEGYLQDWLLSGDRRIAPRGSELYRPPSLYQLLFLDEEVLTPLFATLRTGYRDGDWTEAASLAFEELSTNASSQGYRLLRYHQLGTDRDYLILGMAEGSRNYWGTYVFRAGEAAAHAVQVPRPEYEAASLEFGIHLFERARGEVLLIAGAHPFANLDGSADVLRAEHASLFNLVNQVALRERDGRPMTVTQARAIGALSERPLPEADLIVATNQGLGARTRLLPQSSALLDMLRDDGLQLAFVDGSESTSGLEASTVAQGRYQAAVRNAELMLLWLSPLARSDFRAREDDQRLQRDMISLGIERQTSDLSAWLSARALSTRGVTETQRALLSRYVAAGDILALARLHADDVELVQITDIVTRQAFVALSGAEGVRAVANLAPRDPRLRMRAADADGADTIAAFLDRRAAWLEFDGGPR